MRKFIDIINEGNRNTDVKDIAKSIRQDIIDGIKSGSLPKGMKCGVKIDRFAGGASIDVTIRYLPDDFKIFSDEYIMKMSSGLNISIIPHKAHTKEYFDLRDTLKNIVNAYNYDNSDSQYDYFDSNFFTHVDIDDDFEKDKLAKEFDAAGKE